jgi:hypothetical protein
MATTGNNLTLAAFDDGDEEEDEDVAGPDKQNIKKQHIAKSQQMNVR